MINNLTKHDLRSFVIPNCTYEKAKFLARRRRIPISSLIRELINEDFKRNNLKIEIGNKGLPMQTLLPFAQPKNLKNGIYTD